MSLRSLLSALVTKKASPEVAREEVHATTACHRFGHLEFQIRVSSTAIPDQDIAWFLRFFEERVAAGEKFQSGESLQVGWMYTTLEETDDGFLRVMEPDMTVVPVRFIDSVDRTLMHMRNQKDVVQSLLPLVEPDFPTLRQSAVVHVDYKNATRVLLTRTPPLEDDSGWWFTDLADPQGAHDPGRFTKTSLYQLGIDRPDLVKFFALPAGLQVVVEGPLIGVLGPDGELEQTPGSYLSELNRVRLERARQG
ncbi:hypothetical protein J2W27_005564 [Variovorax boronicumulans]|uniref:immunity protein Imm33 domain-containing protein n=1 Tax=Variovorax boronicumulans TaxID=436515 RepID=UPI00278BA7FF|nr:hypothetical protein [Variovorax boronicumulans]MDP9913430.1 hypothetical protein [Variovorax boronicumulans]